MAFSLLVFVAFIYFVVCMYMLIFDYYFILCLLILVTADKGHGIANGALDAVLVHFVV